MKSKYSAYAHLEKMQNAKKPIHRFYRLRLAHAVDTMVINVCRFIIVSLAGPLSSIIWAPNKRLYQSEERRSIVYLDQLQSEYIFYTL